MNIQFKKGDEVRVVKNNYDSLFDFTIGHLGTVVEVFEEDQVLEVDFDLDAEWGKHGWTVDFNEVEKTGKNNWEKKDYKEMSFSDGSIRTMRLVVVRDYLESNGKWRLFWEEVGKPQYGVVDESTVTGNPFFKTMKEAIEHGKRKHGITPTKANWIR